jgi:hypothetical protein
MLPLRTHSTAYTILACAYLAKCIHHSDAGDLAAAAAYFALGPGETVGSTLERTPEIGKSLRLALRRVKLASIGRTLAAVATAIAMTTPLR